MSRQILVAAGLRGWWGNETEPARRGLATSQVPGLQVVQARVQVPASSSPETAAPTGHDRQATPHRRLACTEGGPFLAWPGTSHEKDTPSDSRARYGSPGGARHQPGLGAQDRDRYVQPMLTGTHRPRRRHAARARQHCKRRRHRRRGHQLRRPIPLCPSRRQRHRRRVPNRRGRRPHPGRLNHRARRNRWRRHRR